MKKHYITPRTRVCEIEASYILQGLDSFNRIEKRGANEDVDTDVDLELGEDDMFGNGMNG